jgi:methionine sulfoxide reductase heme-binding subunit
LTLLAASSTQALWYLTRATGAVALILLTAVVVLGTMGPGKAGGPRWPRFAITRLHRDIALLVLVLLALHIATTILDGFAPITVLDAIIPFRSTYRPIWLGFGAVALDLLLALVITSLLRRRVGYQRWRRIHWLAYASWPVAMLHGFGTGTDAATSWMVWVTVGCAVAVVVAVFVRLHHSSPEFAGRRPGFVLLSLAVPAGLAGFVAVGPMQPHWSARAGTPAVLLHWHAPVSPASSTVPRAVVAARTPHRAPAEGVHDVVVGHLTSKRVPGGALVDLALALRGAQPGTLRVRLAGAPLAGGGLSLTGSQVDLAASGLGSVLDGRVTALDGSRFHARVAGADGVTLNISANLQIDQSSGLVTGHVDADPARRAPP